MWTHLLSTQIRAKFKHLIDNNKYLPSDYTHWKNQGWIQMWSWYARERRSRQIEQDNWGTCTHRKECDQSESKNPTERRDKCVFFFGWPHTRGFSAAQLGAQIEDACLAQLRHDSDDIPPPRVRFFAALCVWQLCTGGHFSGDRGEHVMRESGWDSYYYTTGVRDYDGKCSKHKIANVVPKVYAQSLNRLIRTHSNH